MEEEEDEGMVVSILGGRSDDEGGCGGDWPGRMPLVGDKKRTVHTQ